MSKTKNLRILLEDLPVSYYWLGFLLADGSFFTQKGNVKRLNLSCAGKDYDHLLLYKKYIESDNRCVIRKVKTNFGEHDMSSLTVSDNIIIPEIKEKLGIVDEVKTYSPPNLIIDDNEFFLCLLIGFIDGDGCISKQYKRRGSSIRIQIHSTWLSFLDKMLNRLYTITDTNIVLSKINKNGYCIANISNNIVLKYLKQKTMEYDLPILDRKWNFIDMSYVSIQEISKQRVIEVKRLLKEGKKNKEIADMIGIGYPGLSRMLKRNNLKRN